MGNDTGSSSKQTERAKPTKDITSIYTQAMVKTSTPPASPKPVPSKNRGDITQLYTGGMTTKSPAGGVGSPCIVADKLSPKKVNFGIRYMRTRLSISKIFSKTENTNFFLK